MTKKFFIIAVMAVAFMSAARFDGAVTKENGVYVVNTTTVCPDVEGYAGAVPLKIYIRKNKVEKIEILKNQETPKYMVKVKKALLNAWDGLTVKEAKNKKVDAVTGATFTSKAIIDNVQRGLAHYEKNK